MVLPRDFDGALAREGPVEVTIYNFAGEVKSGFASADLDKFFDHLRDATVRERLRQHALPPELVQPFKLVQTNVAPPAKVGGNTLGGVIPYIIMVLSMMGAMYPAADVTAGEKERGTMETILCSPVARTDLVVGKFLMVLTASLGTVLLSLASLAITFHVGKHLIFSSLPKGFTGPGVTLDPAGLAGVLLMLLPTAALMSAVLLAVSLFARTFREAQSYTGPLMFVIVVPAMIGMLPGMELNAQLAVVPLVNISLACKELVAGTWHWGHLSLIFLSTSAYAGLALAWAIRLFQREEVIFRA